jgi:hypothetical protein
MDGLTTFVIISVFGYFIWKTIWVKFKTAAKDSDAYQAALASIQVDVRRRWGSIDHEHIEERTGIWLSAKAKEIVLLAEGGCHKTYPFANIRSWKTKHIQPRVDVVHDMATARGNQSLARQAKAESGLFLSVKDIDHPTWRIVISDTKMQDRWMEILRQSLND